MKKNILVTGGAGFIGSHTVFELLRKNKSVIVVDNLINSSRENINRIEKNLNRKTHFHKIDIVDYKKMKNIFKKYKIDTVIHFASLKSIPESLIKKDEYYRNNILGTINLLNVMEEFNCKKIVFSSTGSVYSENLKPPYKEDHKIDFNNPYTHSKIIIEKILEAQANSFTNWRVCILRYFNPAGADKSGLIGEDSNDISSLFPNIALSAFNPKKTCKIFGADYPTPDGSAIRDYIHISDIALAHLKACTYINNPKNKFSIFNLGSGTGFSVLEVISEFEKNLSININKKISQRRKGDIVSSYASINQAKKHLGWRPQKTIKDMCIDTYNWMKNQN